MFNLPDMFGKLQEMQDNLKKVRDQLNDIHVEAEAGGGMVRVTANANKRVLKVKIDPELKDDFEMMEDLICAAVNKAIERADDRGREEMSKVTQNITGMLPNLPGMDLSKLGL